MKTMTCKQLGGVCDKEFHAETFEEMTKIIKQHGMEMYGTQDSAHMKVLGETMKLMNDPEAMAEWMENKKKEFDELPEDK